MKSRFAINAEYWALRGFCGLIAALPYRLAMGIADALGHLPFQRRRTLGRIRSVFPGKTAAECKAIAVRSFQGFLRTTFEMMRAAKLTRQWMDEHVVDGPLYKDKLQALVDEGKGVVIMVPHTGNWYMAAWSMAKYGLKLFAIAARQRNPRIDAWINRQYGDIEVLDRDCRDTLGKIKEKLRGGRAFAILPDLRVRKRDVTAEFLGGAANVSRAGAMFAVHTGSPIVVAAMSREGGKHVFHHLATLRPEGRTAESLTQEALKLLSDFVTERPDQWYWYNKRWILEPAER